MGEVYRADDLKLGQPVALKLLPEQLAQDAARLAQFHNEVRVARDVSHRNVCRMHDIGEAAGRHFLRMEYVDGEDLASLLRRIGRFPQDRAAEVARQICAGLAAVHDRGVIHRRLLTTVSERFAIVHRLPMTRSVESLSDRAQERLGGNMRLEDRPHGHRGTCDVRLLRVPGK